MTEKLTSTAIGLAISCAFVCHIQAQNYDTNNVVVQTFAGSGFSGHVDGVGQLTMFSDPLAIVADSSSNLFVLDRGNDCIRRIAPDATVSTFVGGGSGSLPGFGTNVALNLTFNSSMAIDHLRVLHVLTDIANNLYLLRVEPNGFVTRTNLGFVAQVRPTGICVDSSNNVYHTFLNRIYVRRIDGIAEVFAGSGNSGSADGNGIFSSFNNPAALAVDAADNIYVWDAGNHVIRRINQNRDVVTIAGQVGVLLEADGNAPNATFNAITSMCTDNSGNLLMACSVTLNNTRASIRRISAETNVATLAGSFSQSGYTNGVGNLSRFKWPSGVCSSQGIIFVADTGNQRIRMISFNPSTQPVLPADLRLNTYPGLKINGTVGRTYQVQSSPDMTNWIPRAILLLNSSPQLWIDQNPVSGNTFYRALLLP